MRQFAQLDQIDKSVLKSALQEKRLDEGETEGLVGLKRPKDNCLELDAEVRPSQQAKEGPKEKTQNEDLLLLSLGTARQKIDADGNSLQIEKKKQAKQVSKTKKRKEKAEPTAHEGTEYQDTRNVIGVEKSLK